MPALFVVVVSDRSDQALPEGKVPWVGVLVTNGSRAEVVGDRTEYAVGKNADEVGVLSVKGVRLLLVVTVELRGPGGHDR